MLRTSTQYNALAKIQTVANVLEKENSSKEILKKSTKLEKSN